MECVPQQTRGPHCVEIRHALSRGLGMLTTIGNVGTSVFTSQSSAESTQNPALTCTALVERMSMGDVLMTVRAIDILNAETDVCGGAHGQYITIYHVEMTVFTGRH